MTKLVTSNQRNVANLPRYRFTELGKEKLCLECEEYFPADTEFFWATGRIKKNGEKQIAAACKVCFDKRYKRRKYKIVVPINLTNKRLNERT